MNLCTWHHAGPGIAYIRAKFCKEIRDFILLKWANLVESQGLKEKGVKFS